MSIKDVIVPQMGEGLQEVRLIEKRKQAGDSVVRDEILYTMETDKAILEVESPYSGVLRGWLAEEGDVLPIGAPVARMTVSSVIEDGHAEKAPEAPQTHETGVQIPPRTRAYAKQKGVAADELMRITPSNGSKLMPEDIDAALTSRAANLAEYVDKELTPWHRSLIFRLKRSQQTVVPGVMTRRIDWAPVQRYAGSIRKKGFRPTDFLIFAWCVAQVAKDHPRFRSTLIGEEAAREYAHINLGIAVGKPDGQLTTALIRSADALDFETFINTARQRIAAARGGRDQADETVQLHLTYMGNYGVTDAIPVVVAPAVGVIFIGATYQDNGVTRANLTLTFDHRLIQGIEAAYFMSALVDACEGLVPRDATKEGEED